MSSSRRDSRMARREGISDVSNLAMWMTSDWRVCVLRKSNRWWQKWEEKELLVAGLGSRGSGSSEKELLVVTRLGSLAEAMEKGVGSCLNGKSTICSTA